ncbi:MAG: TIGR04438 family Trp-rich protein [Variovorax paradoxus]|uniref:TIGR04438 family Trp-rich protein n=1 Tax=Variovorax paradoxus TaxID=34073 RepID=A0A2W5NZU0_VARPD|nr:MAG: TIGR04438 family Trp-rich protein [Variovorax paradoxus]
MWFLMLGVLGVLLKYFEVGFVATLSWWIVLIPKAMEREQRRKQERIDRQRSQMGMLSSRSNRGKRR